MNRCDDGVDTELDDIAILDKAVEELLALWQWWWWYKVKLVQRKVSVRHNRARTTSHVPWSQRIDLKPPVSVRLRCLSSISLSGAG